MNAILALQVAIGKLATLNLHRHTLDARLITVLQVGNGDLIVVRLRPTLVHTHQHLRPVLRLSTTGSGVNLQHGIHRVLLLAEHVF